MNLRGITCNFKQVQKKRKEIRSVTEKLGRGWNLEPSGTVLSTLQRLALDVCHEQEQDRKGKPFSIESGL